MDDDQPRLRRRLGTPSHLVVEQRRRPVGLDGIPADRRHLYALECRVEDRSVLPGLSPRSRMSIKRRRQTLAKGKGGEALTTG